MNMQDIAYFLAQTKVELSLESVLIGYGPLAIMNLWLGRMVQTQRREITARDSLIRDVTDKNADALKSVAHKLAGMSRALVYNAATQGTGRIREMAEQELHRMTKNE